MKIQDGKGRNGDASVSQAQRLNVSSKSNPRVAYVSRDDGRAFVACYDGFTAAAGDIVAYLKNTSDERDLYIDAIDYHSVENVKWKVFEVTGTAAAGETVTPANLNLTSGLSAEATAMKGDTAITGLTTGAQLGIHRSTANSAADSNWQNALILGPGDAIAVEYDTGTSGIGDVEILFHYEVIGVN